MDSDTRDDEGSSGRPNGSDHQQWESPTLPLPAAPRPSADAGMTAVAAPSADIWGDNSGSVYGADDINIFTMTPVMALKMLCGMVEEMVQMTGDIPPTPPMSQPVTPGEHVLQENKGRYGFTDITNTKDSQDDHDVPATSKTPIGSPEAHPTEPFHIIGSNTEPLHLQHGAIARKFYSKRPPPIPLEEYLLRLQRYCPMSTAVYLASSLYIHRLAMVERLLPVTSRNAHRLVLAALRVAMKALEDLSYPHRRFAKVGGITETELGRLEITFCFLNDFDLRVDREMLHKQALMMRDSARFQGLSNNFHQTLRLEQVRPIQSVVPKSPASLSASAAG